MTTMQAVVANGGGGDVVQKPQQVVAARRAPGGAAAAASLGHAVRARGGGHGNAAPDGAGAAPVRPHFVPFHAVGRAAAAAAAAPPPVAVAMGSGAARAGRRRRAGGEQDHLGRRPPLLDGRELPPQLLRLHRRGE